MIVEVEVEPGCSLTLLQTVHFPAVPDWRTLNSESYKFRDSRNGGTARDVDDKRFPGLTYKVGNAPLSVYFFYLRLQAVGAWGDATSTSCVSDVYA